MTELLIHAPFKGWVRNLDEVPDAAFSKRMVGDGLAIDPLEWEMVAPCDGTVIAVAPTGHSVTLRSACGIELLLHIGIDTVKLAGRGFAVAVEPGTNFRLGDVLVTFDPDAIAQLASSLVTPIVVTSPDATITQIAAAGPIQQGDPLFSISLAVGAARESGQAAGAMASRSFRLELPHGIHARPAAQIARAARQFDCVIELTDGEKVAAATSVSALLALGAEHGDELRLIARGTAAEAAVAALARLFESGLAEAFDPAEIESTFADPRTPRSPTQMSGVKAAPGFAIGPVFRIARVEQTFTKIGGDAKAEATALDNAIEAVSATLQHRVAGQTGPARDIALAHLELLHDEHLTGSGRQLIAHGHSAASAWRTACRAQQTALEASGNARVAGRAADYRDIERQVLQVLAGDEEAPGQALPEGRSIIIADELLPSEFLDLDRSRVAGICTGRGGATSHVAILAASHGLPMLVALGDGIAGLEGGQQMILNADQGYLETNPSEAELAAGRERIERQTETARINTAAALVDCVMADGTRIEVFANLASEDDARAAITAGAEGCGLLRTEFLFLDRDTAPSEQTQIEAYAAIATVLAGRPLIVRTLDIGGDKPVPYLPMAPEDNPALGARGIRQSLVHPDLFETQLRAILRGVPAGQCRIMLPMVIEADEVRAVRKIVDRLSAVLGLEQPVPLGVMIETPAAALLSESLAEVADFLSVGSNDLTQYALAMDRGNPQLAARADGYHPAVLKLIAEGARGAARHGRWFGICGGLASDPDAAALLIGLGVNELSVTPNMVPAIKARIRCLSRQNCTDLAQRALTAGSAGEVQQLLSGGQP